jgi:predicted nicotinamide N-methyase
MIDRPSAEDADARRRFVLANTTLLTPPLVPEIWLYLAEESLPIWQKTEDELGEINVPPPFWAFAWAGGQALARYLIDTPHVVAGKTVLDLGSGSGLTGIVAKRCGAIRVLASDIDGFSAAAILLNAEINGVAVEVTTANLLAGDPDPFDVVLVGDLFYERPLAERVLSYVTKAAHGGATVFAGDPERSYFPHSRFNRVAEYKVPVTRELEDAEIKKTSVWTLTPA